MLLLHLRLAAVFLLDRWEALNRRLLRVVGYAGRIQRKVQENHHCNRDQKKGGRVRYLVPPTQPRFTNNAIVFRFPILYIMPRGCRPRDS